MAGSPRKARVVNREVLVAASLTETIRYSGHSILSMYVTVAISEPQNNPQEERIFRVSSGGLVPVSETMSTGTATVHKPLWPRSCPLFGCPWAKAPNVRRHVFQMHLPTCLGKKGVSPLVVRNSTLRALLDSLAVGLQVGNMGALIQWMDDIGLWSKLDLHYTDETVEVLGGLQSQLGDLDTQKFRDLCH